MTLPLLVTLLILVAAILLFLGGRFSADLIAMLVVVALGISGVLTLPEALSGFSRSAVITIISIFILAEGLKRTGVTDRVGKWLFNVGGTQEWRLVATVMLAGAFLSLFMNNIAAASMLLPAVIGVSRRTHIKPSRLLLPLAFATILGGMATLLTTTNIVASNLLRDNHYQGYGLLDFAPVGIPVALVGIAFMAFVGRRFLPGNESERVQITGDLVDTYHLEERLVRVRVPPHASLAGSRVRKSSLRETYGMNLVAIERHGEMLLSPDPETVIAQNDILLLEGRSDTEAWENLKATLELLPSRTWDEDDLESPMIAVVEAVLAPRSHLIGQTLHDAHFRDKFGMVVLAIWRAGKPIISDLANEPLQFGDALLLQGPRSRLKILEAEQDLIMLDRGEPEGIAVPGKENLALGIFITTLVLTILWPAAIGQLMLAGALIMVIARLLTMDLAYRAIEWKSVFLVAGMLPVGVAITKTGAADLAANAIIGLVGTDGPLVLLTSLVILTVLLTQVMNGAAVAAILVPITIQASQAMGLEPRSMVMAVTLATSMAFITPLGHAVNILVMAPGGYEFRHFIKAGAPLTALLTGVVILLLPLIWHLTPR